MPPRAPAHSLPAMPFFSTPQQRVALARERFFQDGVRPSGLVSETVIQSWARCMGARRRPGEMLEFDPVTKTRIATTLMRSRQLLEAARDDLTELDAALAGTRCKAMLTSHDGVIVHATPSSESDGQLMPIVARVGVDIGESSVGTGAPGVAARTGEVCLVLGEEHFFTGIGVMYCAAAPIRDARGDIAAVLDLSSEAEMFRFDAAAMVQLYATGIENRLLESQSRDHLLLRFQASPALLHTPLEGLAAIDGAGRVAWLNASAASLLGCARTLGWEARTEAMFGLGVEDLLALAHAGATRPHRLPSGLMLWVAARMVSDGGTAAAIAAPPAAAVADAAQADAACADAEPSTPARLEDANRALIEATLADCKGNVSRAARRLGVSRGLLYRRLREWGAKAGDAGAAD